MRMLNIYPISFIMIFPFLIWSQSDDASLESFSELDIEANIKKSDEKEELKKLKAEIDSLRKESERLKKEAKMLEVPKDGDNVVERIDDEDEQANELRTKLHSIKDTVQILTREGAKAFLGSFIGKKRNTRERGYGGGIGPVIGLYSVNVKPLKKLLYRIPKLSKFQSKVDSNYEVFVLMGGMGYGAVGNGLRIGGGGRGGAKSYSFIIDDTTTHTLEVSVGFGGFLFEKCFVLNNMNFFLGGMAGGGGIGVSDFKTVFQFEEEDEKDSKDYKVFDANFMLLEFHGGFTYSFVQWLHMGLDMSIPFFVSPKGFKNKANLGVGDGFMTINPGLRIRIIFGNIG